VDDAIAIAIAVTLAVTVSIAIAVNVAIAYRRHHHHCRWPLLLQLPLPITAAISFALPSAIVIAVALAIGHCHLHYHWQSQLPSPLVITIAITVANCQKLLPWRGENIIQTIQENNAYLILFCLESGRCAASGEQQSANGGSCWQQGGSRVEALPVNGRCCFVGLLGCLTLTDGVCDDVLDVVEGIPGETVIELTQEEKGIIERYGSDKKMYT
jgi:hypothetical protein